MIFSIPTPPEICKEPSLNQIYFLHFLQLIHKESLLPALVIILIEWYDYKLNTANKQQLLQSKPSSNRLEEHQMIRLKVKKIAEEKGFNQSSLSRAADIHFTTVKRIFQDPYKEVTTTTLEKVARALKVSICELIEELPDTVNNE